MADKKTSKKVTKKKTVAKKAAAPKKAATKKKATPKTVAKPAATKKAVVKKAVVKKAVAKKPAKIAKPIISMHQRYQYIAEAAYYRAEARGFSGDSANDWIDAEAEIDALYDTEK